MAQQGTLAPLSEALEAFADERDWQQFHSPKDLAMALTVEASELLEHFQWLSQAESATLDRKAKAAVGKEIADVQVYLIRLADQLGIDIVSEVHNKMTENAAKYPADRVRGSAKKYSDY